MILVYPMLTSGSVSPNVLPGLTKTLEKFVIIYGTDKILSSLNSTLGKAANTGMNFVLRGSRLVMTENLSEVTQKPQVKIEPKVDIRPTFGGGAPKGRTSVNFPRQQEALSVEPTWLQIETPKRGMQILGVKVLPFPVQSSEGLAKLLLTDEGRKMGNYVYTKYARMAKRIMFRIARTFKIPGLKDKVLTGDPKTDILWATTQYKHNLFVCFNQLELENDEVFSKPATIQKLHKLGWSSFVIADDVNKKATFCMKEFGGLCSTVPYPFMFSSLGREHNKVFEDLEDVRRASGPFFRMVTSKRKVFSEAVVSVSKQKFLDYQLEKLELLDENVGKFAKKLDPTKLISKVTKINQAIKSNDESKLKQALQGVPSMTFSRVENFCTHYSKNFKKNYELGKRVLSNSTKFSDTLVKYSACLLAFGSAKAKDPSMSMKSALKNFVYKTKSSDAADTVMGATEVIAAATVIAITALGVAVAQIATAGEMLYNKLLLLVKAMPKSVMIVLIVAIALILLVAITAES